MGILMVAVFVTLIFIILTGGFFLILSVIDAQFLNNALRDTYGRPFLTWLEDKIRSSRGN
jgi:hypothetical protein